MSLMCPLCGTLPSLRYLDRAAVAAELALGEKFFARRMAVPFSHDELRDVTNVLLGTPAAILRCAMCGTLVREDANGADAFQDDRYDERLLAALHETHVRAFRAKQDDYGALLPAGAHVVEIGSYVGGFLVAAKEWGWRATGVDVGEDTSRFCRSLGLDARSTEFADAAFANETFDAVFIWNCFEQVPDPHALLDEVRRVVRPGGTVVIRVPDADFYADQREALHTDDGEGALARLAYEALLGWPYLYGYNAVNLQRLAREHGFVLDRVLRRPVVRPLRGAMSDWARHEEAVLVTDDEYGWIELTFVAA